MSRYMQLTLALSLGLFLIVAGREIIDRAYFPIATEAIGYTLWGIGIFFWFSGCYLWAKVKGRHWTNMFWGCLWFLGLIILYMMEDRSVEAEPPGHVKRKRD